MKEIAYTIDSELSYKNGCLAIKVTEGGQESHHLKKIIPSQWIQELKSLSMQGKIYFNGKQLALDFYGKAEFFYEVAPEENGELTVSGKLKWSNQEIDIRECDFIFQGTPRFFIKGIYLKIIEPTLSWKEILKLQEKKAPYTTSQIKELQEAHLECQQEPEVVFLNHAKLQLEHKIEPLPFLVLKDRTGAFADLWMDEGNGKKKECHAKPEKLTPSEKAYEKDLIETGFIFKPISNSKSSSNYYCPLDQVSKTLSFLLEIGWKVFDFQGKQLIKHTHFNLSLKEALSYIELKGSLNYEEHEIDLKDVKGTFLRREKFIDISSGFAGLMPDLSENEALKDILDNSEIQNDALVCKRQKIGLFEELLKRDEIKLDEALENLLSKLKNETIEKAVLSESFKGILRPYQQEGVNFLKFLYDFHFHGMLADDMGLGKTVQVLAFLSLLNFQKPVLIVLPATLIFNWESEIKRFTPHFKTLRYHGKERTDNFASHDIILTTYTTLRLDLPKFQATSFECLILDEAQMIKNAKTQIAEALFSLHAHFRLSITGTPIENSLSELWSHFRFLMPELLGEENAFLKDLSAASSDSRYLQRIKKQIRPFVLRRKKEDVAKDLPEKIEQVAYIEMEEEQKRIYEEHLSGIKRSLLHKIEVEGFSKHRMEALEAILRLRQICCHPVLALQESSEIFLSAKLDAILTDIETAVSEGRKILVYSQFTTMLKLIAKNLSDRGIAYSYLDGSTVNREKAVSEFQNNPAIPLFLISLKAGGVGLNLTAADYVFLYDPWWNEAIENQAINRAHRIGQKNQIFAKRYIVRESIEEKMMTLKQNKAKIASLIFDEGDLGTAHFTEDDFKFLLS